LEKSLLPTNDKDRWGGQRISYSSFLLPWEGGGQQFFKKEKHSGPLLNRQKEQQGNANFWYRKKRKNCRDLLLVFGKRSTKGGSLHSRRKKKGIKYTSRKPGQVQDIFFLVHRKTLSSVWDFGPFSGNGRNCSRRICDFHVQTGGEETSPPLVIE